MTDRRIAFLTKQMLSDLRREWTIEEMAQAVYVSPSHLISLFKVHAGISPIQYLRHLKLE